MAKLVCVRGNNKDDEFPLHEGPNEIGREQDRTITLFDTKCSKRHCCIYKRSSRFAIEDLDSTNGTYVNGHKITSCKTIHEGDKIHVGNTKLKLSNRPMGNVLEQGVSDATEELQGHDFHEVFDEVASTATQHGHLEPPPSGLKKLLRRLLRKS